MKNFETKVAFYCSGVACIWVDTSCGENEIVIVAGANESLASSHVEAASNIISGARALGVSLEANRDGVLTAMRIAKVRYTRLYKNIRDFEFSCTFFGVWGANLCIS